MTEAVGTSATRIHEGDTLWIERRGAVAIIWLNRPDKLNAMTFAMRDEIVAAFDVTDADEAVRAVILTGTGRAFCAGADLAEGGEAFAPEDGFDGVPPDGGGLVALRMYASEKPIIAAVNGPSAGVGVTMTLPADVRIASATAKFGFVFARRGLVPEACSNWFLPRVVGIAQALRWTLAGAMVTAADAHRAGLVSEIVDADASVVDRAVEIAAEFTEGTSPVAVALTRQLMWRMLGADGPQESHRLESDILFDRGVSADIREGVTAFLEKRPPEFVDSVNDYRGRFDW
ncbi:enoyl-CoA hydratase-related protein [Gordonia humi]|uniref:Enoyl-CoA hydratase/carnithine racemase n=1 Tax=Gordonia humi TaxID=686429 RepID=A0A840ET28_9ACTN|nr:enoyl-CoA hydratase-related protein [Gordonia humi]MBB4133514.1 enoyl-CoA hydratase/carnithine racemase [Gordonia humi]